MGRIRAMMMAGAVLLGSGCAAPVVTTTDGSKRMGEIRIVKVMADW